MSTPTVTLRKLKNEETGIDLSVPRFQEEEAPLGGVSVLFEISILTNLDLFKTRLHKSDDVVHFSVFKAYREIEELYNKLHKKYPNAGLPSVPKSNIADRYCNEEKVEALDTFMDVISKKPELCQSSIFAQFIGIGSQKLYTNYSTNATRKNSELDTKITSDSRNKVSSDVSEMFPKMKTSNPEVHKEPAKILTENISNIDLFEEVKLVKENKEDVLKSNNLQGLFDELEDDSLFSSKPLQKTVSPEKRETNVKEVKPEQKKKDLSKVVETSTTTSTVHDSDIIIKDRKHGDVSLFEEQDFGEYITKDEEALFLVTSDKDKENKKNTLLLFERLPSSETDSSLNENLDDLLNLEPLPSSPVLSNNQEREISPEVGKKPEKESGTETKPAEESLPSRPVPLPRKKSLPKPDGETVPNSMTKPEVMPRKVFMNKPEVPVKPVSPSSPHIPASQEPSPMPAVSTKPVPPPKPKPPPKKPKPANINANFGDAKSSEASQNSKPEKSIEKLDAVSGLVSDLGDLDILKYIEQEEKTLEARPSLFD